MRFIRPAAALAIALGACVACAQTETTITRSGEVDEGEAAFRSDDRPGAQLWQRRCGACHLRVMPGSRDPQDLHTALLRHRKRLHLSEAEWSELETFLTMTPKGLG